MSNREVKAIAKGYGAQVIRLDRIVREQFKEVEIGWAALKVYGRFRKIKYLGRLRIVAVIAEFFKIQPIVPRPDIAKEIVSIGRSDETGAL